MSAERRLAVTNATNFRDLAAHVTASPGLKSHTLFRSDHLGALDEDDARQIQALGIRRVLDFRGAEERTAAACALPDVTVHSLAIEPTIVQKLNDLLAAGHRLTEGDVVALMQDTYRGFVHDNAPRFAELFRLLLAHDTPTVFHCTAGKDRTGFAAALILLALGVPRDVVMHDYLLTNTLYRRPEGMASHAPEEVLAVLWRVQEEFLDAALHMVDNDFGGLQTYLVEVLGVDAAAQKELAGRYLQAAV